MSASIDSQHPLKNQKALVTGASSGIGEAWALALGDAGTDVVVNYIARSGKAGSVIDAIRKNCGNAIALKADASDGRQCA
jgi:glucose 1-dehydrogenase